jgi:hypothetical protein
MKNKKIFEHLLIEQIDNFHKSFCETTEKVFIDSSGRPIHPNEYGVYREKIVEEFIRFFIPNKLEINRGFIIDPDNVSHQCDIVVYDSQSTPLIQSREKQSFYPIETVTAVGEVKSTIRSKQELKEALIKLSDIKQMRNNLKEPTILKREKPIDNLPYNPKINYYDQIFTFLICKKIDFEKKSLINELNNMYKDKPFNLRHNLIFSLEDGIFLYYDKLGISFMYPHQHESKLKNRFTEVGKNKYLHYKFFCSYLFMGTSSTTILYPEMKNYIGSIEGGMNYDEK